mgnify:CR=1 FL=1
MALASLTRPRVAQPLASLASTHTHTHAHTHSPPKVRKYLDDLHNKRMSNYEKLEHLEGIRAAVSPRAREARARESSSAPRGAAPRRALRRGARRRERCCKRGRGARSKGATRRAPRAQR